MDRNYRRKWQIPQKDNCWRKSENDERLQVQRTENMVERCDKINGKKANTEEEENTDNVNRRKKNEVRI